MVGVRLEIQTIEDGNTGNKVVDRLKGGEIIKCEDVTVGIIEQGTLGGQEAIMIAGKTPDGDWAVMQVTARHLDAIYASFKGAQQRFKNKGE